jgi:tetratricopeptide (TPR) repeat protein
MNTIQHSTSTLLPRTAQILRLAVGITVAAALAWGMLNAGGCAGTHGEHTAKQLSAAKIKMDGIKAATEYKMAEQAFLGGDLTKARKHVEHSISLNEEVAKSHVLRGRVLMEQGDLENASAEFKQAQAVDPKNVASEYYQGILAERIERSEEALNHYVAASELDSTSPQYAIAAAEMMIELGQVERAESYLLSHAANFDHNAGIRQTLGHIAMMKSEPAKAVTLFNEARLLAPDDQNINEDLIRAQISAKKYAEAEYNLGRLLTGKDNKDRRDLKHMQASCLMMLDRPVEARAILINLTADRAGSADAEAWSSLGQVAYLLGDMTRVKQCAGRLVAIAPERPDGYVLRALAQRKAGDLGGARKSVQTALSFSRTSENLVLLGMIQQQMSDTDGARLSFAEALKINPQDQNAGMLLTSVPTE